MPTIKILFFGVLRGDYWQFCARNEIHFLGNFWETVFGGVENVKELAARDHS